MNPRALPVPGLLAVLLTVGLPAPRPASAAVTVTDCGDSGAPGQLRTAVVTTAPGTVINVPACTITVMVGSSSAIPVATPVTIQGAGADATIIQGDGGISGGGGLFTVLGGGALTIDGVTLRRGHGQSGGAIFVNPGLSLTMRNSIVTGNHSDLYGGGAITSQGPLSITSTTISGNTAASPAAGGGLFAVGSPGIVINTTISGNSFAGSGGGGGGVTYLGPGTLTLVNSTITGNSHATRGGGIFASSGTVNVKNTIIAHNTAPTGTNCSTPTAGILVSIGRNLENADSCAFAAVGDLPNTDPQLLSLANYGGHLLTHALMPTSPAIDAGNPGSCPATDQRGRPRVATCDIGAFEAQGSPVLLGANDVGYGAGDTLSLDALVQNPAGVPVTVDAYLAFVLPAGSLPGCPGAPLAFVDAAGTLATACGVTDSPATFAKLASGVTIPAGFLGTPTLFTTTTPAVTASLTAVLALTPAGALDDGSIDGGDIAASSDVGFNLRP